MDVRLALATGVALAASVWLLRPHWQARHRRRHMRGRATSAAPVNVVAVVAGLLAAAWVGPGVSATVRRGVGEQPPAWLADAAPLVFTGIVLVGALELGARGLGVWPAYTCPKLAHYPLALLLPLLAVAGWPLIAGAGGGLRPATAAAATAARPATAAPADPTTCTARTAQTTVAGFKNVQLDRAAEIITAGREMGVPSRAILIAVAVAMQESSLRILANPTVPASMGMPHDGTGADHDSVGLFQQRQGWGPTATLMDSRGSARIFVAHLLAVPGWKALPLTEAAQRVQRSAHPSAYGRWESPAAAVIAAVTTTCSPVRT